MPLLYKKENALYLPILKYSSTIWYFVVIFFIESYNVIFPNESSIVFIEKKYLVELLLSKISFLLFSIIILLLLSIELFLSFIFIISFLSPEIDLEMLFF